MPNLRSILLGPARRRSVRTLRRRADGARARSKFSEAAGLYEAALKLAPDDVDVQIQCAHMWKEIGEADRAERYYLAAQQARPRDADLKLQLGHFYKTVGRIDKAAENYRLALELAPTWHEAQREVDGIGTLEREPSVERPQDVHGLAHELTPPMRLPIADRDRLVIRRLGRSEDGRSGIRRTVRGIEAVRGFCIDDMTMVELRILLDGQLFQSCRLADAVELRSGPAGATVKYKSVFNLWIDFAPVARGLHFIQIQLIDGKGGFRSFRDYVVVADPIAESLRPDSDAVVALEPGAGGSIEQQIRARPSMVRPAARSLFPDGVRSVLVLRTDQLGDLIASIPALHRLRALLPSARIVGLLTAANAELARSLGLFDEQIVIDFPHDFALKRRVMSIADQEALMEKLAPYRFDIALDLAPSDMSRPLLKLSGARFLHGFPAHDAPWLDGCTNLNIHDSFVDTDRAPHSVKTLAMVEALGAALDRQAPVIRRDDLSPSLLHRFGIADGERFIVLHTGARLEFSRWPHFAELTRRLLERTDLKLVVMLDDNVAEADLPDDLAASDRVVVLCKRTSFDEFDALLSFATLVIGNDSGPKHLAALRGTKVITLFTARINWAEWGQENVGWIISRRVPCAGCAIFHEPEECGKGFSCIRDIRVEEVLDAALAALA